MVDQRRATFECDYSGQKRAYADTTTEGRLVMEFYTDFTGEWRPNDCSDEQAKKALRGLVGFCEGPPASPFDPVLRTFEKIGEGVWYVLVVCRYND